jgi:nitrogen fixation protein FixH
MNKPDFGALHIRTAIILIIFSIVLALLIFFGVIHAHYWVAAIPAFYAWARPSAYRLIRDANYRALHQFEEDIERQAEITVHNEMKAAVTLDAEKFLRHLRADDEAVGEA